MAKRQNNETGGEMSFLEHLEALRWHIVRSAIVIVAAALILFLNKGFLFDSVLLAPKNPDFITYRLLCKLSDYLRMGEDLCVSKIDFALISTDLSSQFATHMWSAFVGGLVIGFPF